MIIFDATEQESEGQSVAETSKNAYKKLKENGEFGDQQRQVLKALHAMKQIPTIDELSHEALAGWQKSTISGRLNDLKDNGLVTDLDGDAKRKSSYSGIKSKVWSITDKGEKVLEEIQ